jgi:hypothetical protein
MCTETTRLEPAKEELKKHGMKSKGKEQAKKTPLADWGIGFALSMSMFVFLLVKEYALGSKHLQV